MKLKKKDCCGSSFETNQISTFGLISFSVPLLFLCYLLFLIVWPLSFLPFLKKIKLSLKVIVNANSKLISRQSISGGVRLSFTSFIGSYSAKLSRFLYNFFNHIVLFSLWAIIITGVVYLL